MNIPILHMKRALAFAVVLALCLAAWGCSREKGAPDAFFVRGGLMLQNLAPEKVTLSLQGSIVWRPGDSRLVVSANRSILFFAWKPGEKYQLRGNGLAIALGAPQKPSPALISKVELESMRPHGGSMGTSPDTELSFSPDGTRLAIGSFHGYLRIARTISGEVLFTRKIAEGAVKRLAWGKVHGREVVYLGEQSPDCFLYCLDASDGRELWRRRLADQVGEGRLTSDNRHAIYNLPGVYYLRALPDGDLILVATNGRFRGERFVHDCRLYRLGGDSGEIRWMWPGKRNFPHGVTWVGASQKGGTLAFVSFNTFGRREIDPVFKDGTVYCIDGDSGRVRWDYTVEPLKPYYNRVGSWQGVSVSPDGRHVALGLNDGRAMLFDASTGERLWTRGLGAPVMVGDMPVAAPISYAAMSDDRIYFATPGTTIPSGAGSPRNRRPPPHPFANHLFALDLGGKTLWQYASRGVGQGIFLSADGKLAATASSQGQGLENVEHYGISLFAALKPGGVSAKFLYRYLTEGPVFFQAAISPDGRFIALTESGYSPDEGRTVYGDYQVHVIH